MVQGLGTQAQKAIRDGFNIAKDIRRENSDNPQAILRHPRIAPRIPVCAVVVDGAVDLNDQLGSWAVEVGDIWPDCVLAAESDSAGRSF